MNDPSFDPNDWYLSAPWVKVPPGGGRPPKATPSLAEMEAVFGRWLHMGDLTEPLWVMLATIAVGRGDDPPLWLMLVGPPGCGKTELLSSARELPGAHVISSLNRAGLLTATSGGKARGVLAGHGDQLLILKDMTSAISEATETRSILFGALREVFDGHFTRTVHGREVTWVGKATVLGAVTGIVDEFATGANILGERFTQVRVKVTDRLAPLDRIMGRSGQVSRMQADLATTVAAFVRGLAPPEPVILTGDVELARMAAVVELSSRGRSSLRRGGRSEAMTVEPETETINRVAGSLSALVTGALAIGLDEAKAWALVARAGVDSLPAGKWRTVEYLAACSGSPATRNVADALGHETDFAARNLADLAAHGLALRSSGTGGEHHWSLTTEAAEWLAVVAGMRPTPPAPSTTAGIATTCVTCGEPCDADLNPHPGCVRQW